MILKNIALIGLYTSVGDSYCAELPTSELKQIGELLYQPKDYPIVVHGLKRIWEFLDLNTDELDLKLVTDTKLLAYLLDPDAGETDGLTLTHLAYQYLGEEYPHVASEVQDKGVLKALRESLMRDAQVIWSLLLCHHTPSSHCLVKASRILRFHLPDEPMCDSSI